MEGAIFLKSNQTQPCSNIPFTGLAVQTCNGPGQELAKQRVLWSTAVFRLGHGREVTLSGVFDTDNRFK